MAIEKRSDYPSEWATFAAVAKLFGMSPETLRTWVRRDQIDTGTRARGEGSTPRERDSEGRLKFLRDRPRRSNEEVVRYIDARRDRWGVEPICRALQFAPATYYAQKTRPESAQTTI
jgi:hypothetical protein